MVEELDLSGSFATAESLDIGRPWLGRTRPGVAVALAKIKRLKLEQPLRVLMPDPPEKLAVEGDVEHGETRP